MSPSSVSRGPDEVSHDDILRRFESCTLPPAEFNHRRHLALGWLYLRRYGFPLGVAEFQNRLRAYVNAVGAMAKYHETVTWAYMILMNEEMQLRAAPDEGFDAMIQRRPDLLDHRSGALADCYPAGQLDAADSRRVFMLPRHGNVVRQS